MITYRYVEIKLKKDDYILVEVLDYDMRKDKDFVDTIFYNNSKWAKRQVLIQNKKVFPSPVAFSGTAIMLHDEYLDKGGEVKNLEWVGPIYL